MQLFNTYKCIEKRTEVEGVCSFVLSMGDDSNFEFKSGQFVIIKAMINGKDTARCYSISSNQGDKNLQITVRLVNGGVMSTWLLNDFVVGGKVSVSEPLGDFTINRLPLRKHIIMASAGCGIIPLVTMLKSHLNSGNSANVDFIHCERDDKQIIFLDDLLKLEREHKNLTLRLYVKSSKSIDLVARTERLSTEDINDICTNNEDTVAFICGNKRFVNKIKTDLLNFGIDDKRVICEQYGEDASEASLINNEVYVTLPEFNIKVKSLKGEKLASTLTRIHAPVNLMCCNGQSPAHRCRVTIRSFEGLGLMTVNSCQYELSSSVDIYIT